MASMYVGRKPDTSPVDLTERIRDERDGHIIPIRLPWWQLNKGVGNGLLPGNVTVIAGSPGAAKSFLTLNILLAAGEAGFRWRLLPLEDDAQTWVMKTLAVHTRDWRLLAQPETDSEDERRELGDYKLAVLARHNDLVGRLYDRHIAENPRMPIMAMGEAVALDVTYQDTLAFIEREAEESEIICVDPISQITFDPDGRDWRGQSDFLRKLVALAAATQTHVLLVAHTIKQNGRNVGGDALDGVQGSAMVTRLSHNVLTIQRHDPIESEVYNAIVPLVEHRTTITIAKSRNGFSGTRYAFDMSSQGPFFEEKGMIRPKAARKGAK